MVFLYLKHLKRGKTMNNYGRELLKGSTDSLLLCLISREVMYGYQIIKELEKRTGGYFQFKEGTLYPALHRLEKAGLIKGKWQKLENGQERRYYSITEKGQDALNERVKTWRGFYEAVNRVIQPAMG
jgi:PadR family transcriptional regulator, regulatory protein PadR